MALDSSNISKNVPLDQKIWRYMKPERLIQTLETEKLYFSSLMEYELSDPFEGLFPKIVLRKLGEIIQNLKTHLSDQADLLEKSIFEQFIHTPIGLRDKFREEVEKYKNKYEPYEDITMKILKSSVVNCWHQNDFESEAMWRLYADKGVAIQTTVENLVQSLDSPIISFSEVKYIDFNDQKLTINDCLHQNGLNPLLKRLEFSHEKEARLYYCPTRDYLNKNLKKQSELIDVDTSKLISKVYISPYLEKSTAIEIRNKIRNLGIHDENIIDSELLKIDENMMSFY